MLECVGLIFSSSKRGRETILRGFSEVLPFRFGAFLSFNWCLFFSSRVSCPSWNMDNSMVPRVVEDCDGTRISLDVDNDNNVLLSKRSLVGKMLAGKTRWER